MPLAAAYSCFNNTSDPELAEAYIYEINALRARYDTPFALLNKALVSSALSITIGIN